MRLEDVFITSDSTGILLGQGLIWTVTMCFHKISLEKEKKKASKFWLPLSAFNYFVDKAHNSASQGGI